jgi:predicted nuclease of predicted toxin-antitoxin system
VRFLVDTNLPPALANWLVARGHEAEHAAVILGATADDQTIWAHAISTSAIVVTKDTDYLDLATRTGDARVVLLRCGNLKLAPFRLWFEARWTGVEGLLQLDERVVELR